MKRIILLGLAVAASVAAAKEKRMKWKSTEASLQVTLSKKPAYGMAYPIRLEFKSNIKSPEQGSDS